MGLWGLLTGKVTGREAKEVCGEIIDSHMPALLRSYDRIHVKDDYGAVRRTAYRKWWDERHHFLEKVIMPELHRRNVSYSSMSAMAELERLVAEGLKDRHTKGIVEARTPEQYETMCADLLARAGWEARTTKATGDQGADVIADCKGERLVVQCKYNARPTGNKAVQEVIGAVKMFGASYAIVVAPQGFTQAAQELAAANEVLLLHHDELAGLDLNRLVARLRPVLA